MPYENDATIHRLYVRRLSRLSFEVPNGDLKNAFLEMYNDTVREKMGHQALILYSDAQTSQYHPGLTEEHKAELLDSTVTKRLKHLKGGQYKPTRWIDAVRSSDDHATQFRLNILLNGPTQEQLHASVRDGLNQVIFGKRAVTVGLTIYDHEITPRKEWRKAASHAIKEVLWADDAATNEPPHPLIVATNQHNYVHNINWSSRIQG